MRIKICGITRRDDADAAVQEGAFALGFIFVPASPRYIRAAEAGSIIARLPQSIFKVGVFVNERRSVIDETIRQTGITHIQLHGDETPEETRHFPLPVWKAFRVSDTFEPARLSQYPASAFVLDTYREHQYGGTGTTFEWKHAVAAQQYGPIILSGGITPDNALKAAEEVHPYALDVNSGVEISPGKKDPEKLKKLFRVLNGMMR